MKSGCFSGKNIRSVKGAKSLCGRARPLQPMERGNDEEKLTKDQGQRKLESLSAEDITKEKMRKILRTYDVGDKFSHVLLPKASVLIPILITDGEPYLLFTVRSRELKSSPGDVCFPGGKKEPADRDEIETALREAEEEVGLHQDQVEVIGRLPPTINMAGYWVTPVVAFIDEKFQPRPNPAEVTDVFMVPLVYFVDPEKHSSVPYVMSEETSGLVHCFEYKDTHNNKSFKIFGLTANFALILALMVLEKKPSFDVGMNVEEPIPLCERLLAKVSEHKKSKL